MSARTPDQISARERCVASRLLAAAGESAECLVDGYTVTQAQHTVTRYSETWTIFFTHGDDSPGFWTVVIESDRAPKVTHFTDCDAIDTRKTVDRPGLVAEARRIVDLLGADAKDRTLGYLERAERAEAAVAEMHGQGVTA